MRLRTAVCGTRWLLLSASAAAPDDGATLAGACRRRSGAPPGPARSTSSTVMRPAGPVPRIADGSTPRSLSRRRTAGLNPPAAAGARVPLCTATGLALAAAGAVAAAAGLGAWASAAAPVPVSMRPSSSPGAISSCSCLMISRSTPVPGEATSTVTLSVSISMSGSFSATRSPTCLSQRRICERVPSVCSAGALISTPPLIAGSQARQPLNGLRDAPDIRHRRIEQHGAVGTWDVRHGEPLVRGLQAEEALLRQGRGNFRPEACGQVVLVHDLAAVGLLYRGSHGRLVPGREGAQIEQLHVDLRACAGELATLDHGPPADHGHLGTGAQQPCLAKGHHELVARIRA